MADMPETNDAAAAPISTVTKPLAESIQINGAPKENGTQPELSNAEKKKLAKAEKAAKRAAEKEAAGLPVAHQTLSQQESVLQTTLDIPQGHSSGKRRPSMHSRTGEPKVEETKPPQTTGAPVVPQPDKQLPIRVRRASDTTHDTKEVGWVSHLYGQSKRQTLEGSNKEVHPAIQVLGAQLSSYEICGSHARCVAMLLAMKSVIQSYSTPAGTSLPRHLASHHLSPQLAHLKSSRPFSTAQANTIRWLKNRIAVIDPSIPEIVAKESLCDAIDNFIRERFINADKTIAKLAAARIKNGDVILTYAKSAVVTRAFLLAARGTPTKPAKRFRVVIIDSRPLNEGLALRRALHEEPNIDVSYYLTSALAHAAGMATQCMLGAHAVLGNGRLYSRIGSALVAMSAHHRRIPVYVLAETIKFSERIALDAIVANELAPAEELIPTVIPVPSETLAPSTPPSSRPGTPDDKDALKVSKGPKVDKSEKKDTPQDDDDLDPAAAAASEDPSPFDELGNWRETPNLYVLNPLYDVTPAEYITLIITEMGILPPASSPVLHRSSVAVYVRGASVPSTRGAMSGWIAAAHAADAAATAALVAAAPVAAGPVAGEDAGGAGGAGEGAGAVAAGGAPVANEK